MLIIVIAIGSIWLGKEAAAGYLYLQFEGLIGKLGALKCKGISTVHERNEGINPLY